MPINMVFKTLVFHFYKNYIGKGIKKFKKNQFSDLIIIKTKITKWR